MAVDLVSSSADHRLRQTRFCVPVGGSHCPSMAPHLLARAIRRATNWKDGMPQRQRLARYLTFQAGHVYRAASRYRQRGQVRDLLPVLLSTLLTCPACTSDSADRSPSRCGPNVTTCGRLEASESSGWSEEPSPPGSASGTYDLPLWKPDGTDSRADRQLDETGQEEAQQQTEDTRVLAGLGSGDGPPSVRVRPSSLKRDRDRKTTSTGGKCLANVHAKSRFIPEPNGSYRVSRTRQSNA